MAATDDDPVTIPNEVRLFRRIHPEMVVFDDNRNHLRPTSQNFQDSRDGTPMSVFAENLAHAHGELPSDFLQGRWSEWGLAAVMAGRMRELGQRVYSDSHNQDEHERFESHSAVAGSKKKVMKQMSATAEWVITPRSRP